MNKQAGFFSWVLYTDHSWEWKPCQYKTNHIKNNTQLAYRPVVVQKVDSTIVYPLNEYISLPGIMQFFA